MKANSIVIAVSLFILAGPIQAASNQLANPTVHSAIISDKKINLNKADVNLLSKSIKGIGEKRAEAIVKYREQHGSFNSIEELAKVKGFGKQFVKTHLTQLQEVFALN